MFAPEWFHHSWHFVFEDVDEDGFPDELNADGFPVGSEPGILEQAINLRCRDGTIYQSFPFDFLDFANGWSIPTDPQLGKVTGFFPSYYGELIIGHEFAITRATFSGHRGQTRRIPVRPHGARRATRRTVHTPR